MQLAITILGKKSPAFITEVLTDISNQKCSILELNLSELSHSVTATYLLVEGNWNYLAKLESVLESLQRRLELKIHTLHVEPKKLDCKHIPYTLEIITIENDDILQDLFTFLVTRRVVVEEIKASCYPDSYTQTPLFSAKLILLMPLNIHLLSFRDEILQFCDSCNIDALFEPIKR